MEIVRMPSSGLVEDAPHPDAWVEEEAIARTMSIALYREVRKLPVAERRAVALHFGLGCDPHSVRETADAMGTSAGSAHRLIKRGVARLRDALIDPGAQAA